MIYDIVDQRLMTHKQDVFIPKSKVLEMVESMKEDSRVSGFFYGLVKRK